MLGDVRTSVPLAARTGLRPDRRIVAVLVAVTVAGGALRFATLGVQSLWLDESATVLLLRKSFTGMLGALPGSESAPPLYYCAAWLWARVFGLDAVGVRSLSALVGTLTIPVAYLAARSASRAAGVCAAVLAAASPMLFYYAQEARPYALLILLAALSFVCFVRAAGDERRGLRAWAAASAAALLTHYFAAFVILPEAAALARRRGLRACAPAFAAVGVVAVALLPLAVRQRRDGKSNWIADSPLLSRAAQAPKQFLVGIDGPLEIVTALVSVLLVVLLLARLRRARHAERALAGRGAFVAVVAVGLPLLLSVSRVIDVFDGRNVVAAWMPAAVVPAVAAGVAGNRRAAAALVAALAVLWTAVVAGVLLEPKLQRDDWRDVARAVKAGGGGRFVVGPANADVPLEVYLPGSRAVTARLLRAVEIDVVALPRRRTGRAPLAPELPTAHLPGFRRAGTAGGSSYLVERFVAPRPTRVGRVALETVAGDAAAAVVALPADR